MSSIVDFVTVSTAGLDSSPIAEALAGLRANEARYITNKYGSPFAVSTPDEDPATLRWVTDILREERGIVIASPALEVNGFEADGIRFGYVFYASGLAINVMYTLADEGKRAVGFKLSLGMEIPEELSAFKFARQRSKLAGEIRGSYFVIKGEH
ncbi:hypothetical protein [Microbacterium azadirachtae]|uniref:Phage tail protein n=1 Tax=Microbacterium azadirachtae TaxID=582680 RepID=A0A0F0LFG3_9MICO|nr:hypothetical protein [Microbacterium azadirachtae]KJL31962.1 hypothetical protein RS86_03243 [Microbacterium azadirachtae]